ncbi:MAG: hypothetical protein IT555_21950 [Acetobacteraceae bacterium]|nr:hypothetical protein [Acetobacteraceae bacterium]
MSLVAHATATRSSCPAPPPVKVQALPGVELPAADRKVVVIVLGPMRLT